MAGSVIVIDSNSESEIDRRTVKRRRLNEGSDNSLSKFEDSDTEPTSFSDGIAPKRIPAPRIVKRSEHNIKRRNVSHVAVPGPAYPRSAYQGYEPPLAPIQESEALDMLLAEHTGRFADRQDQQEYVYIHLEDFAIYTPGSSVQAEVAAEPERSEGKRKQIRRSHAQELISLHRLQTHKGPEELLFDGTISCGSQRCYLQGVRFKVLTIDYDEDDAVGMNDCIFIQSEYAKRHYPAVWYQLRVPAKEYTRFYNPFLWLVEFTKYFVDFLSSTPDVSLQQFQHTFGQRLQERYAGKRRFEAWLQQAPLLRGQRDFRGTVNAYVGFLWKECSGLSSSGENLLQHQLWDEVDELKLTAIPRQPNIQTKTVITPYAYESFKHMYFADRLEPAIIEPAVAARVVRKKLELGLTPLGTMNRCCPRLADSISRESILVRPGDVVAVLPDSGGHWKSKAKIWYAYVQKVQKKSGRELHLLWFYQPGDTTIGVAAYRFENELFLSDNCDDWPLSAVMRKVEVAWFIEDPAAADGFFVRQKFRTVHEQDTHDFVTLKMSDFACGCGKEIPIYTECTQTYNVNDTVLMRQHDSYLGKDSLQPAQIISFDANTRRVLMRRLELATSAGSDARPNELRLTSHVTSVGPSRIIRKCHMRFVDQECIKNGVMPTPYDRDGAGDCYFIRLPFIQHQALQTPMPLSGSWKPSEIPIPLPNEASDVNDLQNKSKLRGMGIFCGGGSFDRGLEDGGSVEFKYAIDWAERALHTYRANARSPESIKFWLGSINDHHSKALEGQIGEAIAGPEDVDLISAGSPCPGFSMLQVDKNSVQSRTNASMIASVVSFVDFYSPQYCISENVVAMTYAGGPKKDENVFSQMISAFVAMGYQVQQFLGESWLVSSCQQRSRVLIVASAPGVEPFPALVPSHRHPADMKTRGRALGRLTNGSNFGMRKTYEVEPLFPHFTPLQATKDLPDIGDGQVRMCPQFPDHVTPCELSSELRDCIAVVPVRPEGTGLMQAYHAGFVPAYSQPWRYIQGLNEARSKVNSKTLARVSPSGLFPTITTSLKVHDGNHGRWVHWQQHRMLTVMEARRAQGFLDDEVIIGSPAQQIKIIGNSVDRKVSLVLGLALRESWFKSPARTDVHEGGGSVEPEAQSETHSSLVISRDRLFSQGTAEDAFSILLQPDSQDSHQPCVQKDSLDLERASWDDETEHDVDDAIRLRSRIDANAGNQGHGESAESLNTYDLERGAWEDSTLFGIDGSASSNWPTTSVGVLSPSIDQGRPGTLGLSDEQKQDIRAHGFKAITRILPNLRVSSEKEF